MITDSEVQSLKFHLGYGSIGVGAEPYVDFVALFEQVIAPNLSTGAETTSASKIVAGVAVVTPASLTGIVPYARLVVDVGADAETVTVQGTTASTFTARFQRAHEAGCPLAVMSGVARLRTMLQQADAALAAAHDPSVGATSGLKQVDKGDVEWQPAFQVLKDRMRHYREIVNAIGSLVRVSPRTSNPTTTSVY